MARIPNLRYLCLLLLEGRPIRPTPGKNARPGAFIFAKLSAVCHHEENRPYPVRHLLAPRSRVFAAPGAGTRRHRFAHATSVDRRRAAPENRGHESRPGAKTGRRGRGGTSRAGRRTRPARSSAHPIGFTEALVLPRSRSGCSHDPAGRFDERRLTPTAHRAVATGRQACRAGLPRKDARTTRSAERTRLFTFLRRKASTKWPDLR